MHTYQFQMKIALKMYIIRMNNTNGSNCIFAKNWKITHKMIIIFSISIFIDVHCAYIHCTMHTTRNQSNNRNFRVDLFFTEFSYLSIGNSMYNWIQNSKRWWFRLQRIPSKMFATNFESFTTVWLLFTLKFNQIIFY